MGHERTAPRESGKRRECPRATGQTHRIFVGYVAETNERTKMRDKRIGNGGSFISLL